MTQKKKYDLAIIGAGPGGYVAAIKAGQMGKSVALIEKGDLGGTCLNVGCIPTKTYLSNSAVLEVIRHAKEFGIEVGSLSFDYGKMKSRKDQIVAKIRKSLEGLLKSNAIHICRGTAQFTSPFELKISGEESCLLSAEQIIIATGSIPLDIKAFPCDHKRILNSTSILEISDLPKSLAIVGGGYIGCEFASFFAELGVKVTILEALPSLLSAQGTQISQFMTKIFLKRGVDVRTNVKVTSMQSGDRTVIISLENGETLETDLSLIAVGRQIFTENLGLEKTGISLDEKGAILTDSRMQTNIAGIYAIGDVTGQWMLAHVASHQGMVAASNACGVEAHIQYEAVPAVVYTSPEIATVGLTEDQAKEKGFSATTGMFPFLALGKAQASSHTEGFAQIVSDPKTGQIFGAQVIGHDASNLIGEVTLAIQNELTLDCIIETIHAHPTMSESWLEAALLGKGTPIHFPPKVKKL